MTDKLTDEQLREIKARCEVANKMGAISPVPRWQIEAMATELLALRAERAKLEGVREPTEAMLNAARDWSVKKYGRGIGNADAIGCWQAMFDALAQPAGGGATERWWDTGGREHLPRAGAKP